MPVLRQAADEGFVNLDNSAELINILHESHADLVTHGPRCFIRAEAHIAFNLQRAHAFLAGQHEMDDAIPIAERLIRVFEDCSGNMRKTIASIWSDRHSAAAVGAKAVPKGREGGVFHEFGP